jgi:hypothetical protein
VRQAATKTRRTKTTKVTKKAKRKTRRLKIHRAENLKRKISTLNLPPSNLSRQLPN